MCSRHCAGFIMKFFKQPYFAGPLKTYSGKLFHANHRCMRNKLLWSRRLGDHSSSRKYRWTPFFWQKVARETFTSEQTTLQLKYHFRSVKGRGLSFHYEVIWQYIPYKLFNSILLEIVATEINNKYLFFNGYKTRKGYLYFLLRNAVVAPSPVRFFVVLFFKANEKEALVKLRRRFYFMSLMLYHYHNCDSTNHLSCFVLHHIIVITRLIIFIFAIITTPAFN